jgi:hypothetical protein
VTHEAVGPPSFGKYLLCLLAYNPRPSGQGQAGSAIQQ